MEPPDRSIPAARWYLTPWGRVARAAIGLPILALAAWVFARGGLLGWAGGVLITLWGFSLPLAAIVQEPD